MIVGIKMYTKGRRHKATEYKRKLEDSKKEK